PAVDEAHRVSEPPSAAHHPACLQAARLDFGDRWPEGGGDLRRRLGVRVLEIEVGNPLEVVAHAVEETVPVGWVARDGHGARMEVVTALRGRRLVAPWVGLLDETAAGGVLPLRFGGQPEGTSRLTRQKLAELSHLDPRVLHRGQLSGQPTAFVPRVVVRT